MDTVNTDENQVQPEWKNSAQIGGWDQTKANPKKETHELQHKRKHSASKSITGF